MSNFKDCNSSKLNNLREGKESEGEPESVWRGIPRAKDDTISPMYNWSVDTKFLRKFPEKYRIWRLEQLINFGLGSEKIDKKELTENFDQLEIDPAKKKYLKFVLFQERRRPLRFGGDEADTVVRAGGAYKAKQSTTPPIRRGGTLS